MRSDSSLSPYSRGKVVCLVASSVLVVGLVLLYAQVAASWGSSCAPLNSLPTRAAVPTDVVTILSAAADAASVKKPSVAVDCPACACSSSSSVLAVASSSSAAASSAEPLQSEEPAPFDVPDVSNVTGITPSAFKLDAGPEDVGILSVGIVIPAYPRLPSAALQRQEVTFDGTKYVRVTGHDITADEGGLVPESLESIARSCATDPRCTAFTSHGRLKYATQRSSLFVSPSVDVYVNTNLMSSESTLEQSEENYLEPMLVSLLEEVRWCQSDAFGAAYHAFIYNNAQVKPDFTLFYDMKAKYREWPCLSFIDLFPPSTVSADQPLMRAHYKSRREPARVKQGLDIVANIRDTVRRSLHPFHVLLWEDDCRVCPGAFDILSRNLQQLAIYDSEFGYMKVGAGASGILINRIFVPQALSFVESILAAESIDVALFKYLEIYRHSDYLSRKTFSAHHGLQSVFSNYRWNPATCGEDLEYWWGKYKAGCPFPSMDEEWRCVSWNEYGVREDPPVEEFPPPPSPPDPLGPFASPAAPTPSYTSPPQPDPLDLVPASAPPFYTPPSQPNPLGPGASQASQATTGNWQQGPTVT